jgi:hypothetical protein
MSKDHTTRCSEVVGVQVDGPWAGMPRPCDRPSIARHPGITERWAGICQLHLLEHQSNARQAAEDSLAEVTDWLADLIVVPPPGVSR